MPVHPTTLLTPKDAGPRIRPEPHGHCKPARTFLASRANLISPQMQRQGHYPLPPGVTETLGVEFSGTIEESESGAFQKGQEVFGLAYGVGPHSHLVLARRRPEIRPQGAYAEYITVAEGMVIPKPKSLSHEQAAAIRMWSASEFGLLYMLSAKYTAENWLTAYQALFLICEMKAGERVLIHAGASGVGLALNQLARSFGA